MSHPDNASNSSSNPMWLVTGTSSGLGLALAQNILRHKHNLISISRHPKPDPSLTSLASTSSTSTSTVDNTSPTLHHIQIDLSAPDPETIKSPIRTFLHNYPHLGIDVLVNNAGMVRFGALETISPAAVFETMNTNFYSPLWITQVVLPRMRSPNASSTSISTSTSATAGASAGMKERSGGKVILNVSSTQGLACDPSEVAYDASKHALEAMSSVLAAEVAPFGIRVIVANLGSFRTQFSGKATATAPSEAKSSGGGGDGDANDGNGDGGDGDGVYGPEHPVTKRIAMVTKYSKIPNAARGDVVKGAAVLFDAVLKTEATGEEGNVNVNEALEQQREWSVQKGDGRGRVERLVLGSDAMPKVKGIVEQLTMQVESCAGLVRCVDAEDVK